MPLLFYIKDAAFELLYQRLKQQVNDRSMEFTRNSMIDVRLDDSDVSMGDDKEMMEDALIARCTTASKSQRLMQATTNRTVAEQVIRVFEYREFWLERNNYVQGDIAGEAAWLQAYRQVNAGFEWQEMTVFYLFIISFDSFSMISLSSNFANYTPNSVGCSMLLLR